MTDASQIIDVMPLDGLSRKERRRIEDRHDILEAATALFAEKGFEKTTLDDIASAAGFGKGTLYTHFENKGDILRNILQRGFQMLVDAVQEAIEAPRDPVGKLRTTILTILSFFESNKTLFRIFYTERRRLMSRSSEASRNEFLEIFRKIIGLLEQIFDEGIASGSFRRVDSRNAAYLVLGAVNSQVHCWMEDGASGPLKDKAAFLEEALLTGLGKS